MFHFISASGGQVIKGTMCVFALCKSQDEFSKAVEGCAATWICNANDDILKLKVPITDPLDQCTESYQPDYFTKRIFIR